MQAEAIQERDEAARRRIDVWAAGTGLQGRGLERGEDLVGVEIFSVADPAREHAQHQLRRRAQQALDVVIAGRRQAMKHRVAGGVRAGSENFAYRAFWFYLLDQGVVRAGTANSDSHALSDSLIGTPRTIVFTTTTVAQFDADVLNANVKAGHMVGTNGPMIEARRTLTDGTVRVPSVEPIDAALVSALFVRVVAAPWVPVDEVRVIVNGDLARSMTDVVHPADRFGTTDVERFEGGFDATALLPARGDAWIVIEAGERLPIVADLDCDGFPETGDTNQDGAADWRDVDADREAPAPCTGGTGDIRAPGAPLDDARGPFSSVTPDGFSFAFTNPFVLDRGSDGYQGPGFDPTP